MGPKEEIKTNLGQYSIKIIVVSMEKETMYWLFTTAPQAVAALVGIIFTGMFFMAESIDNWVRADQSLTERLIS